MFDDRVVPLDDIVRLLPRRFSPRRDIPTVCEKLSDLRDREVLPAPFDSRQHPLISCSVTGFCVRTEERDFIGYPVDAPNAYMAVVFLHEVCHWARNHRGQSFGRSSLIRAAAPTLHDLGVGERIQEILTRRSDSDDQAEREAEGFAYAVVGSLTSGVHRIDPYTSALWQGVHAAAFARNSRRRHA